MKAKSSLAGSDSPAPTAGEDPRDSELHQLLNKNNWLNGSRDYRHKALAQFVSNNNRYAREKLQADAKLRQQFFSALADCELAEFKILIRFIAKSRVLTEELKTLLTDVMNKNANGYSDPQWNKALYRSTLAKYLVHSDTIAHALLSYSMLPSTDPAFVARVLLNKIGAPAVYFTQIDSPVWHIINTLKGLVELILPSFLFSFKNPPIPSEVLACIEEAPRDLASAKAEASSNAAKICITFNTYGWSKPKEETEPSPVPSPSINRVEPRTPAKRLVNANATFLGTVEEFDQTFMEPALKNALDESFCGSFGVPPSPIKFQVKRTLLTDDELADHEVKSGKP